MRRNEAVYRDGAPGFLRLLTVTLNDIKDPSSRVFEDRSHGTNQYHATTTSASGMSTSPANAAEGDTDSDTDTTSSYEIITAFEPTRLIKPLPRRCL